MIRGKKKLKQKNRTRKHQETGDWGGSKKPIALSFFKPLCRKKDSHEGCGLYDDI